MSDEQITKYLQQLYKVDPEGKLAAEFLATGKLPDASVLEGYSNYTDNYANYGEFTGNKYEILGKFYQSQDGRMPSAARMKSFMDQHPGISAQEVTEWFNKTNRYKAEYEQQRKEEAGKKRREMEVNNDWGIIRNALASDYEKQRYINDPQSAIFGKEAAGIVGSSAGAKADLATGVLAAGADLIPKPSFVALGPAIRASRDVAHKVSDSPYQKDWSQIGRDAATDVLAGGAAMTLANARKVARVTSGFMPNQVQTAFDVAQDAKAIKQGISGLHEGINTMSNTELYNYIRSMPESSLKNDLMNATADAATKGIDRNALGAIVTEYEMSTVPGMAQAAHNYVDFGKAVPFDNAYLKKAAMQQPLTRSNKVQLGLLSGVNAVNTGAPGYMIMQGSRDATGAFKAEPTKRETKVERAIKANQKEWYKANYVRDWEAGFRPKEIEGDPLWEAYKAWKEGK